MKNTKTHANGNQVAIRVINAVVTVLMTGFFAWYVIRTIQIIINQ
jgi:hypothetical protein